MQKNTRITQKQINQFIENNLYLKEDYKLVGIDKNLSSYMSKIDNSWFCFINKDNKKSTHDYIKVILKRGITELVQSTNKCTNIGFNPSEQKWYGWSHRAIFGFGIGSECKQGDCGFNSSNKEDFIEDCLRFWGDTDMDDTYKVNPIAEEGTQDGRLGIWVRYTYNDKVPNELMRGQISGIFSEYPEKWGRGQWTAKTIEDAKQMAIDFAKGVN